MNTRIIAQRIGNQCRLYGVTLSICESCTGGLFSGMVTSIPGSSAYFTGSIVAYANWVKKDIVGVRQETLTRHGAVSSHVAREMAQGIRSCLKADIGVSITGIAGPSGGNEKKPVGCVFIGIATAKGVSVKEYMFHGSRKSIRLQACEHALRFLESVMLHELKEIDLQDKP